MLPQSSGEIDTILHSHLETKIRFVGLSTLFSLSSHYINFCWFKMNSIFKNYAYTAWSLKGIISYNPRNLPNPIAVGSAVFCYWLTTLGI